MSLGWRVTGQITALERTRLADWLREAAYIQRNIAWQGWAGALRFLDLRRMLAGYGIGDEAFYGWMQRINRARAAATLLVDPGERDSGEMRPAVGRDRSRR